MAIAQTRAVTAPAEAVSTRKRRNWGPVIVNGVLALICIMWTIPTIGLLVSSLRPPAEILNSPWWNIFPHQEWVAVNKLQLPTNADQSQPQQVEGYTVTDQQLRSGATLPNGHQAKWLNRRGRLIGISDQEWKAGLNFTLSNYTSVLFGQNVTFTSPD